MCYTSFLSVLVVLPLLSAAHRGALRSLEASNQTTAVLTRVSRRDTPTLPPPFLHLPVFVDSSLPLVEKEKFSPSKGTGQEPLPGPAREILIPVRQLSTGPPVVTGVSVKTSCKLNKMHVQVQRSMLGTGEPRSQLKLGTCQTSKLTKDHVYFEYDFNMCGTKRTVTDGGQVAYTNKLHYDPPKLQGPIRRTVPFILPVACYYNRYQYSYKIGYMPKMRMRKIFKSMKNTAKFILTPRNAQWERLYPSDPYMLGKPMYFEAEGPSLSNNKRLYIHWCYVTPDKSHKSALQFPVVKNSGCMIESKHGHSRFIPYKNNAVRFSVDAFLFKGMTDQQLYMHCTMSVGSSVPSATAKACNYDTKAGRWVELYGPDSVCTCCDSNCSSVASTVTKTIRSRPWMIEPKVKPSTSPQGKTVSTSTTTTPAPRPETTRGATEVMEVSPMGKVENTVKDLKWPFGDGGVKWVEMEVEEKQVKGSAVVEEEEERVTELHRIFEEIFDFDK